MNKSNKMPLTYQIVNEYTKIKSIMKHKANYECSEDDLTGINNLYTQICDNNIKNDINYPKCLEYWDNFYKK